MRTRAYSFQPQLKRDCYHVAEAPDLYVRKVSLLELVKRWFPHHLGKELKEDDAYYVECQKGGFVDWKYAKVYTSSELIGRNNVFVMTIKPTLRS